MRLYYLKKPELWPETLSFENGVRSCYFSSGAVFALGGFDGVHLGHFALLRRTAEIADEMGIPSAVWTFDTAPGAMRSAAITTEEQRLKLFADAGIELAVTARFDDIKSITAESFVRDILIGFLNCRTALCGYNFTFGKGGAAHSDDLTALMRKYGSRGESLEEVKAGGLTVSSTRIRKMLASGKPDQAALLLGRPFSVEGKIIGGRHLGRRLGVPTCNQRIPEGIIVPKLGVYSSTIEVGNAEYNSVTNIGMRPTVAEMPGGDSVPIAETHITDSDVGELYGQYAITKLLGFIRSEIKFDSVDDLAEQMRKDIELRKSMTIRESANHDK